MYRLRAITRRRLPAEPQRKARAPGTACRGVAVRWRAPRRGRQRGLRGRHRRHHRAAFSASSGSAAIAPARARSSAIACIHDQIAAANPARSARRPRRAGVQPTPRTAGDHRTRGRRRRAPGVYGAPAPRRRSSQPRAGAPTPSSRARRDRRRRCVPTYAVAVEDQQLTAPTLSAAAPVGAQRGDPSCAAGPAGERPASAAGTAAV